MKCRAAIYWRTLTGAIAGETNARAQARERPPVVVVIGAGFAGLAAARALAGKDVQVVVIDQNNYHTFRPLLYQVATAGLSPGDIAYPARAVFARAPNVVFRHGLVTQVDPASRTVSLAGGAVVRYDRLIVACGARASYHRVPGAQRWSLPLYTLDDARRLRNHLLRALETVDEAPEAYGEAGPTFVVVGAGPTGVETAGALLELIEASRERDRIRFGACAPRVVLLDGLERALSGFSERSSRYATKTLESRGVVVRLGTPVAEVARSEVRLVGGEVIPAHVVVWAGGLTVDGAPASMLPARRHQGGRVVVDPSLALPGHQEIFVVGDAAAAVCGPNTTRLVPQLAPAAIQAGRHAARQGTEPLSLSTGLGTTCAGRQGLGSSSATRATEQPEFLPGTSALRRQREALSNRGAGGPSQRQRAPARGPPVARRGRSRL